MEERYAYALAFFILCAASLILYSIFGHHLPVRKLRKTGNKTKAKVLRRVSVGGGYLASRFLEVSFITTAGEEITTEGVLETNLSVLHNSNALPDEVDIYYDKNNPQKIAIGESGFNKNPIIYLILGATVLFALVGIPLYALFL